MKEEQCPFLGKQFWISIGIIIVLLVMAGLYVNKQVMNPSEIEEGWGYEGEIPPMINPEWVTQLPVTNGSVIVTHKYEGNISIIVNSIKDNMQRYKIENLTAPLKVCISKSCHYFSSGWDSWGMYIFKGEEKGIYRSVYNKVIWNGSTLFIDYYTFYVYPKEEPEIIGYSLSIDPVSGGLK